MNLLSDLILFYEALIFVWVLGSWFPQWRYQSWYRTIEGLVNPYLALLRPLRLNFGGLDFSAMLGLFLLEMLRMSILHAGQR